MYITEKKRTELKSSVASIDEWLKTLKILVKVEELNESNLPRTAQLFNKTNQMNLSTRRLTESELLKWVSPQDRMLWTFRVSDKFGDSGLAGIASVERQGDRARIVDFILSCRVFGRKIEETMLHVAMENAKFMGVDEIFAIYKQTPKNKPCLDFLKRSGLQYKESENMLYTKVTPEGYPLPEQIKIENFK